MTVEEQEELYHQQFVDHLKAMRVENPAYWVAQYCPSDRVNVSRYNFLTEADAKAYIYENICGGCKRKYEAWKSSSEEARKEFIDMPMSERPREYPDCWFEWLVCPLSDFVLD